MNAPSLSALSSASLTSSITNLRRRQRTDDLQFLWLLAEIDRRHSFADLGFASLWDFCTVHLRLSAGATGRRICAARLLARFPAAAEFLADGRLGLTTFGALKDILTAENHLQLLRDASLKSEREVDELVRVHKPLAFTFDTIVRTVPASRSPASSTSAAAPSVAAPASSPPSVSAPLPPARVRALDAEHVSLTLRVSKEFMADLEQVSAALSHIIPGRKPADVLRECMLRTLDEVQRRRGGLPARKTTQLQHVSRAAETSHAGSTVAAHRAVESHAHASETGPTLRSASQVSCHVTTAPVVTGELSTSASDDTTGELVVDVSDPRAHHVTTAPVVTAVVSTSAWDDRIGELVFNDSDPRDVPIALARAVWEKDGGSCSFVGANGRRCCSTHQLQVHHILSVASGGLATLDNLTLHCRFHNLLMARRELGDEFMSQFSSSASPHDPPPARPIEDVIRSEAAAARRASPDHEPRREVDDAAS